MSSPARPRPSAPWALLALALAAGCGSGSKGNHMVRVTNAGRNVGASVCAARDFRWINVATTAGKVVYASNIVVTVGQTTDVPFDLPSDGNYLLQVGAWVPATAGEAVWMVEWSAAPMAIGGTTNVHLETDDVGYQTLSTADGLPPQGCSVACTNP